MNLHKKLEDGKAYFIAEMSANHGNDLEHALAVVDAAATAGADCLKVQTYTADTMTIDCHSDLFRIKGGLWDGRSLYELYDDASFPWEWHGPIKQRCEELGIDFLSTPFDRTAVDYLCELDVDAFKIASFELTDIPLLKYASSKGKTMIVSTGMATLDEIKEAVDTIRDQGNDDIILLRCNSEYPANPLDMNLASIPDMIHRFKLPVGFSDHSMGHVADVIAATLGARVIEKHFCTDRSFKTADSEFSMEPGEFAEMVEAVNMAISSIGEPAYTPSPSERPSLAYRRSIFAVDKIPAGEQFTDDNIRVIRPSYGAHPRHYESLLGTSSQKDYDFGDPIIIDQ